jgi:hypothetical protein
MDDAAFKRDRLAEAARRLAQRVGELRALEADRRRRAELERVSAERNRLAEEMARMVEPIVQIATSRSKPSMASSSRQIAQSLLPLSPTNSSPTPQNMPIEASRAGPFGCAWPGRTTVRSTFRLAMKARDFQDFDPRSATGLGMRIVRAFLQQLNAEI